MNEIDYDDYVQYIRNEIATIMKSNSKYKSYTVKISREQFFSTDTDDKRNTIYIVVEFGSASINFGQTALPVVLTGISEQNSSDVCQDLLSEFALRYNLQYADPKGTDTGNPDKGNTILQIIEMPDVTTTSNAIYDGYRSVVICGMVFVVSAGTNDFDVYYIYDINGTPTEEKIDVLTTQINVNFSLDSQPFYKQNNFSTSIVKYATITISFSTYLLKDSAFIKSVLEILKSRVATSRTAQEVNKNFKLKIKFLREQNNEMIDTFKIVSLNITKNIGEIPAIGCSFTN